MIKFRLYFDKDAETIWLNELAAKGWAMKKFFAGFYSFEKCEPGEYTYQVDFGDRMFAVSKDYREFMEDTGVEIVQTWGYWIILRKRSADGPFELYTDVDSSIAHYTKIRTMFRVCSVLQIICLFFELWGGINGFSLGYAFAFLIGAILFVFFKAINKTSKTIAQLKERKGESASQEGNSDVSALLPCGLLLNACALMLEDSVSHPIKITVQLLAILFMLIGIYQTAQSRRK